MSSSSYEGRDRCWGSRDRRCGSSVICGWVVVVAFAVVGVVIGMETGEGADMMGEGSRIFGDCHDKHSLCTCPQETRRCRELYVRRLGDDV